MLRLKNSVLSCFLLLAAGSCLAAGTSRTGLDAAAMKQWQDMRFGMFIHWGPVSLTGHEIGWSRGRQTPIEEYDQLYKRFNPVQFNADEWVRVAKEAGMKYVVLTTKHHDGFCLWDTKQTDYNIMNSPFGRDVVKELAAACKTKALHLALTIPPATGIILIFQEPVPAAKWLESSTIWTTIPSTSRRKSKN